MFKDKKMGRCALVTGASSGIGKAIAVDLALNGAEIIGINCPDDQHTASETIHLVEKAGGKAVFLKADVSDEAQVKQMISDFISISGSIDILVNNAGTLAKRQTIEEMDTSIWRRVFAVNLDGIFFVTRASIPYLKMNQGSIVNITSVVAYTGGGPESVHYAATKGALMTFTLGLAKELAPYQIRVNAVAPGPILTPFHDQFSDQNDLKSLTESTLMERFGNAEEVAHAVVFLASEAASYMTGAIIDVNGGMCLHP
jgi:3-oxoacyl-[acyl-carrier protein] reductase